MTQTKHRISNLGVFVLGVFAVQLICLSAAASAQSLGAIAKKERKRRADNDKKDVTVIDDTALSRAVGDGLSVTGAAADSPTPTPTPTPKTSTSASAAGDAETSKTDSAVSDDSASACAELKAVEAEIARVKQRTEFRTVPRKRTVIEGIDAETGRRYRVVNTTPKHTLSGTEQKTKELAALKARWAELRGRCTS